MKSISRPRATAARVRLEQHAQPEAVEEADAAQVDGDRARAVADVIEVERERPDRRDVDVALHGEHERSVVAVSLQAP